MHGFKFSSVFSSITGVGAEALLKQLASRGKITLRDIYDCCDKRLRHVPEEIFAAVNGELDEIERKTLRFILKRIDELDRDVSELSQMLRDLYNQFEQQLQIATSIPGISLDSAMLWKSLPKSVPNRSSLSPHQRRCANGLALPRVMMRAQERSNPAKRCTEILI